LRNSDIPLAQPDNSDIAASLAPFLPYSFSKLFGYAAACASVAMRRTKLSNSRLVRWLNPSGIVFQTFLFA
jgi:hypothetical protein